MLEKKVETPAKVQVDMEKCLRVSKKVLDLLQRKTRNSAEAYFAVRLVGIFLEEKLNFNQFPSSSNCSLADNMIKKLFSGSFSGWVKGFY